VKIRKEGLKFRADGQTDRQTRRHGLGADNIAFLQIFIANVSSNNKKT